MDFQLDQSGINSLAGFAYQIKVFAYYAFELKDGMNVEFETIEDVNVKTLLPRQIDTHSHKFVCKVSESNTNTAIQVKHTSITNAIAQQLIFNWVLLEQSPYSVEKYILFTDESYKNSDDIFSVGSEKLYKNIIASDKKDNATISKMKNLYENDYDGLKKIFDKVKAKFDYISLSNIDSEIENRASMHFRKAANVIVFRQRLNEFLQHITAEIMKSICSKTSFSLTYSKFINIMEDICSRFTTDITIPCYSDFKRINAIDLKDSKFASSREYFQLKLCELPDNLIKQNLLYGMYYQATSLKYMENDRTSRINDIEETTFESFERIKFILKKQNEDSPFKRLDETKKQPNSFAENEQIRFGSSIHLTKDDTGEKQISWKDENDA